MQLNLLLYMIIFSLFKKFHVQNNNLRINFELIYHEVINDFINHFHLLNLQIFGLCNLSSFIICLMGYMELGFICELDVSNRLLPSMDGFLFIICHYDLVGLLDFSLKAK